MKTAEAFAECSSGTRLKVGACVVKDMRIIGVGYNALPKHIDGPLEDENNVTLPEVRHAEKSALMGLLRAGISPVGAEMFVTHSCCKFCGLLNERFIMNILYAEINNRTKKSFGIITEDTSIQEIFEVWEAEAKKLEQELQVQGLQESAKEVSRILEEQVKIHTLIR